MYWEPWVLRWEMPAEKCRSVMTGQKVDGCAEVVATPAETSESCRKSLSQGQGLARAYRR